MPDLKIIRYAHCLFCEDIRVEMGNKFSLMGVLGSDLYVHKKTPTLSKICALVTIATPVDEMIKSVTFRVEAPNIEPVLAKLSNVMVKEKRTGGVRWSINAFLTVNNYTVKGDGKIDALVETEAETYLAGRLHIHLVDELPNYTKS